MKKILISNMVLILFLLQACNKNSLNQVPHDALSNATLWTSVADATAALNGVYAGEAVGSPPNDNFSWNNGSYSGWVDPATVIYFDCMSDNAFSQYPWEGFQAFGNGTVTPSLTGYSAATLWSYGCIQRANFFLANIGQAPIDTTLKNNMIAQVRFIRAHRYFIMSQLYGGVPLVTTALTPAQANTVVRASKADITKFILSELAAAIPNLTVTPNGGDGHITAGAATALKARIELYEGDYADCITDCQSVMKMGYALFPSYSGLFRIQNEDNSEVIADVQYASAPYANSTYLLQVMPSNSSGGQASINPLQSLVDSYEMANGKVITDPTSGYDPSHPYANRDPRLSATILYPGEAFLQYNATTPTYFDPLDSSSPDWYGNFENNCTQTGYIVKKFTSNLNDFNGALGQAGLDIIVMRYAEVLLSFAEAKIESNQIDGSVYAAINAVRQRAGMPVVDQSVYNDQASMRTLIRRERRVELAMEGLRWFDIQRWKIGSNVMPGPLTTAKLGTINATTGQYTMTGGSIPSDETRLFADKNYLWPVPQAEININKNLTQNPGY